jgi:hypothetical protein
MINPVVADRLDAMDQRLAEIDANLSKQNDELNVLTSLVLDLLPNVMGGLRTIYEQNLAAVEAARKQKAEVQTREREIQNSPVH